MAVSLHECPPLVRSRRNPPIGRFLTEERFSNSANKPLLALPSAARVAAHHALFWMLIANAAGLLLSLLLIFPHLNDALSPFTYGRWIPVHLNLHLYGSTSLPLVAWLIRVYAPPQSDRSAWSISAVWAWSFALALGAASWLGGASSGKIFLDWSGPARWALPLAMTALWVWLAWCSIQNAVLWNRARRIACGLGLLALLPVPFLLFWSSGPEVSPPVNPDTGGPTGVSLLGSILIVVFLLLAIPATLGIAPQRGRRFLAVVRLLFVVHFSVYLILHHDGASHRDWLQIAALSSAMLWAVLIPLCSRCYPWTGSRCWRMAYLSWFVLLVLSGWITFLPGVLDRLKFTDGLVAHSHLAMAGFTTSFCMFLLSAVAPGRIARTLSRPLPFWAWHLATLGYVVLMSCAGWLEGADPGFTQTGGWSRECLYGARAACGGVLCAISLFWWIASRQQRPRNSKQPCW